MSRNSESHFSTTQAEVSLERSKFDWTHRNATTLNAGYLYPIDWQEILPGDTVDFHSINQLIRMSTPQVPVMDEAVCDIYTFFVPNRLLWTHWEELMGANKSSYWAPSVQYEVPSHTTKDIRDALNTTECFALYDALGIPVNVLMKYSIDSCDDTKPFVSDLPMRAYNLIWNEWFRDENLQYPVLVSLGDSSPAGDDYSLLKACKLHDVFTSCLPAPQRGAGVGVSLLDGTVPVRTYAEDLVFGTYQNPANTLRWKQVSGLSLTEQSYPLKAGSLSGTTTDAWSTILGDGDQAMNSTPLIYPSNLGFESSALGDISINSLRIAFQTQRLLEKDARFGSGRYKEILKGHFGVDTPDARLQRPEYITGSSMKLNMQQIAQTSATSNVSPQGHMAAYSVTLGNSESTSKSFTEHGILMTLCCIRYNHSYSQGVDRKWRKFGRFDYYWPTLAHIGEVPVYSTELYAHASPDEDVFGYQEPWFDYRTIQDRVSGLLRPDANQSLGIYNYSDNYSATPVLSSPWIQEDEENVYRTLAVTDNNLITNPQFICDFYFDWDISRCLPTYSIPGLIDHF